MRVAALAVLGALGTGCNAIQDAGSAHQGSGFDRTPVPSAPGGEDFKSVGPGDNRGLVALCKVPSLPARTPAQLAVVSKTIQDALSKLEQDTYTPQLAAIVRSGAELLAAVESEAALAAVDPKIVASFKGTLASRNGSVATNRAKLAAACGAKKPG